MRDATVVVTHLSRRRWRARGTGHGPSEGDSRRATRVRRQVSALLLPHNARSSRRASARIPFALILPRPVALRYLLLHPRPIDLAPSTRSGDHEPYCYARGSHTAPRGRAESRGCCGRNRLRLIRRDEIIIRF